MAIKRKFQKEYITKTGWTRWIPPKHGRGNSNYKMACCDCSLVHEMQFRTYKGKVIFRARRDNKSTRYLRNKFK